MPRPHRSFPVPTSGRRATALGLLLVCASLPWSSPAAARVELERSTPAADSVVASPPTVVELEFVDEVVADRTLVVVVDPRGVRVDLGDQALAPAGSGGRRVTVSLRTGLVAGEYAVHWRSALAADRNESFGSFLFEIATGAPGCADGAPASSPVASPATSPASTGCSPVPTVGALGAPTAVDGMTIELRMGSSEAGPIDLTVLLADAGGAPIGDAGVTVRAKHLEMSHDEFPRRAAPAEPGRYVAAGVGMGMGGAWRVAVDVVRPSRAPVTLFVPVDLTGLR